MNKKILIAGGVIAMATVIRQLPSIGFKNYNKYDDMIKRLSVRENIPYSLIKALIATESGFNPDCKATTSTATGLMQMTKGACEDVNVSHEFMNHPMYSLDAGCKYLSRQIKSTGGLFSGIRAYYEGAGSYKNNLKGTATETQKARHSESLTYLLKVLSYQVAMTIGG